MEWYASSLCCSKFKHVYNIIGIAATLVISTMHIISCIGLYNRRQFETNHTFAFAHICVCICVNFVTPESLWRHIGVAIHVTHKPMHTFCAVRYRMIRNFTFHIQLYNKPKSIRIIGCKHDIRMRFQIKGTSALRASDFTMHGNTMLKSLSKPRTDSFPCHTACIQLNYNSILIDYFYCAADIFKVVYRMPSPSSVRPSSSSGRPAIRPSTFFKSHRLPQFYPIFPICSLNVHNNIFPKPTN